MVFKKKQHVIAELNRDKSTQMKFKDLARKNLLVESKKITIQNTFPFWKNIREACLNINMFGEKEKTWECLEEILWKKFCSSLGKYWIFLVLWRDAKIQPWKIPCFIEKRSNKQICISWVSKMASKQQRSNFL